MNTLTSYDFVVKNRAVNDFTLTMIKDSVFNFFGNRALENEPAFNLQLYNSYTTEGRTNYIKRIVNQSKNIVYISHVEVNSTLVVDIEWVFYG